MDFFRRAIALDSGYAAAYAALSQTIGSHAGISGRAATPAEYQERLQLLDHAIELGPNVSDAYAVRSINRMAAADWEGARADLEKAVALDPHDSRNLRFLSRYYASQGELSKAIETIDRAIKLDPLDAFAFEWRAAFQAANGQRATARADLERALAISPQYEGPSAGLGFLEAIDGRPDAALKRSASMPAGPPRIAIEAAARCGLRDSNATAALDAWVRTAGRQSLRRAIATYAACGAHDKALTLLERTLVDGSELLGDFTVETLKYSVDFLPLRAEPRFRVLLRKMNLPD
jgi:tetratricopeptide (TPR) repeat protein